MPRKSITKLGDLLVKKINREILEISNRFTYHFYWFGKDIFMNGFMEGTREERSSYCQYLSIQKYVWWGHGYDYMIETENLSNHRRFTYNYSASRTNPDSLSFYPNLRCAAYWTYPKANALVHIILVLI